MGTLLSAIFWAHFAISTAFKTNGERYVNPGQSESFLKQGNFRRLVLVGSFRHGPGCRCCDSEIIKVRAVTTRAKLLCHILIAALKKTISKLPE